MKRILSHAAVVFLLTGSTIAQIPGVPVPPKNIPGQAEKSDGDIHQKEIEKAATAGDRLSTLILLLQHRLENQKKLGKMPGSTSQADELEIIVLQLAEELRDLKGKIDKMDRVVRP